MLVKPVGSETFIGFYVTVNVISYFGLEINLSTVPFCRAVQRTNCGKLVFHLVFYSILFDADGWPEA